MAKNKITTQSQDFSQWYLDVIKEADLAEYSKVKGCMIIKPYGYRIWELIQREMDDRIKAAGVQNCYFPLFIPESFINREKEHVKGFAPECAIVTHGGGKKLAENLYVRPTSETIMYDTFSEWGQSYRDLPLLINQWANIVRWEMRTRPFLRTTEFLWQEGHTAHATLEEADIEAARALKMYNDFDKNFLALPVLTGKKSRKETFAGALYTLATEALAKDGKAIQAGTSHNLGQGFAKSFNIQYQDEKGELQYVWQTSWGVSTRLIGTIIVVHGDDHGLVLPPKVAPYQIVIIPIYKTDQEKDKVLEFVENMKDSFDKNLRVHVDNRENLSPGFKFNEWEVKGAPIRIEVGPKDLEKDQVVLFRRDTLEKMSIESGNMKKEVDKLLSEIQENIYKKALEFQKENTFSVNDYNEFKNLISEKSGFYKAYFCCDAKVEEKIQDETKATIRVILDEDVKGKRCFYCGGEATQEVVFAKAY
ncbi:MAG: Proline-tRNA ligase [Candidatus Peregrinibacteria bacterium GW2011_GWA2_33_10]|nr:MAG: Proline-tRNA ligase [Candidatus Peregrinibacteria bacterium GW2011_GWA2_33_10]